MGDRHVQKVEETASSLALFVVATKRGALHRPAMADATVVDLITKLMEEELDKSTDREDRIKAVKRLPDVTAALGIEKTLEMLIPLLDRKITEDVDEDEMMLAVSGLLGKLVPAVGGAANAMVLFEPLLKLSKVEETLVRESATRSIIAVTDVIVHPTEAQAKMASDGLTSMYSDTECFFSKLSACGGGTGGDDEGSAAQHRGGGAQRSSSVEDVSSALAAAASASPLAVALPS